MKIRIALFTGIAASALVTLIAFASVKGVTDASGYPSTGTDTSISQLLASVVNQPNADRSADRMTGYLNTQQFPAYLGAIGPKPQEELLMAKKKAVKKKAAKKKAVKKKAAKKKAVKKKRGGDTE